MSGMTLTRYAVRSVPQGKISEADEWWYTRRPLTPHLDCAERGLAVQATRTCSEIDCSRPAVARNLCGMHVQRAQARGTLGDHPIVAFSIPREKVARLVNAIPLRSGASEAVAAEFRISLKKARRWISAARAAGLIVESLDELGCVHGSCSRPQEVRGLCHMHYSRWQRAGAVGPAGEKFAAPIAERFWERVEKTSDCWLWQGYRTPFGHGQCADDDGRIRYAHRLSYAMTYGEVPDDLVVRHRCDVPACVRPDHLELGTFADNTRDMIERGRAAWQLRAPRGFSVEENA